MFNFHLITEELRKQLYDSVSVVITRSGTAHKHQAYLRRISRILKDPALIVENKEQLVMLIDKIIDDNRI